MYKSYAELGVEPEKNRDLYSVLEITSAQQKRQIIAEHQVVCIDIFTNWCGPCKQSEPAYSVLAQTYAKPGICAVVKENLEQKLTPGVQTVPMYLFFVRGKKVDDVVGANLEQVEEKLKYYLQRASDMSANEGQGPTNYRRNTIRNNKSSADMSASPPADPQSRGYQGSDPQYHQPYMRQ